MVRGSIDVDHVVAQQDHRDAGAVVALAGERDRGLVAAARRPRRDGAELDRVAGVVDVDLPGDEDRARVVDRDTGVLAGADRERPGRRGRRHRKAQQHGEQTADASSRREC